MDLQTGLQIIGIAVATFLVTQGIKSLSKLTGHDLTGAIVPLISVCVALAGVFSPSLVALIPAEYQSVVSLVVIALAGSFGASGAHVTVKRFANTEADNK